MKANSKGSVIEHDGWLFGPLGCQKHLSFDHKSLKFLSMLLLVIIGHYPAGFLVLNYLPEMIHL